MLPLPLGPGGPPAVGQGVEGLFQTVEGPAEVLPPLPFSHPLQEVRQVRHALPCVLDAALGPADPAGVGRQGRDGRQGAQGHHQQLGPKGRGAGGRSSRKAKHMR